MLIPAAPFFIAPLLLPIFSFNEHKQQAFLIEGEHLLDLGDEVRIAR